jgi:uncharacterized protein YraI
MKRFVKITTFVLMTVCLVVNIASASAARMYGVCQTTQYISVRSGPGTTYSRVYPLRNGEPVQTTGDPNENGFIKIDTPASGWVKSTYLSSTMPAWWTRYGDPYMSNATSTNLTHFQHDLNIALNLSILENGIWGTQTRNTVKQLQQRAGITVDGIAGTYTKFWTYNLSH